MNSTKSVLSTLVAHGTDMIRLFERILMFLFASNLTFFSNLTNCTPNSSHFFPFLFFCRDDDTLDVEFSDYEGDYGSSQPDYGITSNYRLIIFRESLFLPFYQRIWTEILYDSNNGGLTCRIICQ